MIRELILRWARNRDPDFVIGGRDRPYLVRWWLIPRNPVFNIYVHCFLRSDDDRALHDHPWSWCASWILDGAYIEWVPGGAKNNPLRPVPLFRRPGQFIGRRGPAPHRVQLHSFNGVERPCWTVFITGPRVREWGFFCDHGWVHWREFTAADDPGSVGRGCS